MAPTTDQGAKDAQYLFEVLRDSPQPIVIHITPYAEKTGTKANTIQKRLEVIKKRNNLNISTTTSAPSGSGTPARAAPRTSAASGRGPAELGRRPKPAAPSAIILEDSDDDDLAIAKGKATALACTQTVKSETKAENPRDFVDSAPSAPVLGLPSPAASNIDTKQEISDSIATPSKRAAAVEEDNIDGRSVKRARTEKWCFA